ncbi:hypothetical protein C8Q73DRAFT_794182 [Cubamyces lactineus]|nr:hypothetical protein C8Q73DRAFT_794182 [Cubamyces lactineus]
MLPFQAEGLVSFGTMSILTLLALNIPGVLANPASAALALARIYAIIWTHKARLCSWLISHPGPLVRWTTFVAAPSLWHVVWGEVLPGTLLVVLWLGAEIASPLLRRSAACVLALGELSDVAWIAICAMLTLVGFLALATVILSFLLTKILALFWACVYGPLQSCFSCLRSACSRVHHLGKAAASTCASRVKSAVLGCITTAYLQLCLQVSRLCFLSCSLAAMIACAYKTAVNIVTHQALRLAKATWITVFRLWSQFVALHDRILLCAFAKLDYASLQARRLSRRTLRKATQLGAFLIREPGLVSCAVVPTLHILEDVTNGVEVLALMPFLSLSYGDVSALPVAFHSYTAWGKGIPTSDSIMKPSDSLQDAGQDSDATLMSIDTFEGATYCGSEETCSESSSLESEVSELLGGTPSSSTVPSGRAPRAHIPRSMSSDSVFAHFARPRFARLVYMPKADESLFQTRPSLPFSTPGAVQVPIRPAMPSPRPGDLSYQNNADTMFKTQPGEQQQRDLDLGLDLDLDLPPYKRTRRAGKKVTARRRRQQEMVARAATEAMMQAVAAAAANAAAEFAGRDGRTPKVFVQLAGGMPAADETAF